MANIADVANMGDVDESDNEEVEEDIVCER